ncbi:PQQ-dependent sugar dehydrogenase [Halomonas sp. M4R5S39]|uniref:PQQ-dependent sugar dehydrogenase n=1 Tax=Halomonas kalidii TaxID=3043293 RepID=UPI0024A9A02B|nr:PQQ-dependent sugar dehydrogenase [Halomonas kalidii]MDI5984741.1 PQQ-dependent sugar dehydrogenase [Halomonas kalidii]
MRRFGRVLLTAVGLSACTMALAVDYRIETLAEGLDHPWSLAFLPGGGMLVTERVGRLRLIDADGTLREAPVAGVPEVFVGGQAGLFEVALAPDHPDSGWVYLSYACGTRAANTTCLDRARFDGRRLVARETLFRAEPDRQGRSHYGGRLTFLPDDTLVLGLGDGFDYREQAQNPGNHLGSLVRLTPAGSVPGDNPFVAASEARAELYSIGHRNIQGVVFDETRSELLIHEHGPRGGDELNRILPGANYGWPLVTHGVDYTGARVTPFTELPGFEPPLLHWTPSIAPSGMTVYDGERFPEWRGDLFVAALAARQVRRLIREDGGIVGQEALFTELDERIRDVRSGPDGALYLLTDSAEGRVLRVMPAP